MGHADGNKRDRRFAGTEIYFVKKQESARVKKAKHTALITAFGTMKPKEKGSRHRYYSYAVSLLLLSPNRLSGLVRDTCFILSRF